jgi:chemotaxis protein MotA
MVVEDMDLATLIGLVLCFALMIFGITFGNGFGVIKNFINVPSILITFGGAFCATLASYKLNDFIKGLKGFSIALKQQKFEQTEIITKIIELSNVARKEGLLALEEAAEDLGDAFMKKGILLIVDGTEPDLVRAILETELSCIEQRHSKVATFWDTLAAMGPAWGMIGTLIGLINMLQDMDDPTPIGPAMAVALITTLYGSMLANWVATPLANKLRANNAEEITLKEVMIEGLLSIQAGENPRVIEEKLKSFLAPADREKYAEGAEGGGDDF